MNEIVRRVAMSAGVTPEQCKAVLEALRDPPPAMIDAGVDASVRCSRTAEDAELCIWRAMVDSALEPERRGWRQQELRLDG